MHDEDKNEMDRAASESGLFVGLEPEAFRDGFRAALAHRDKRVAELEAIVAKLPKTADGVPVVPGMKVWQKPGLISGKAYPPREVQPCVLTGSTEGLLGEVEEYMWTYYASDCYSTREAAEAARSK